MKNNNDQWIEEVIRSMEGSERAIPSSGLFRKIEQNLISGDRIIPLNKLLLMAAASVLLLMLNFIAVTQSKILSQNDSTQINEPIKSYDQLLISDYSIYKP
jgi:hypothetical protein